MSRRARDEGVGATHHVVVQGNGRCRIVEDDTDRAAFLRRYRRIGQELGWVTFAACLMDTHHHAVLETSRPNLGEGLRRLQGGHARWFNLRHGREGSLFRQHAWSRRIESDDWLFRACLYVVLNPVAAGLCTHPRGWRWCSYATTAEGDPDVYAPREERLLGLFGDSPREARLNDAATVEGLAELVRRHRTPGGRELWRSIDEAAGKVSD